MRSHYGYSAIAHYWPVLLDIISTVPEDKMSMFGKRICSRLLITAVADIFTACSSNEKRPAETGPVVSRVQTEIAHLESAPQLYQAVGAVHSVDTALLAAQVGGTVREIHVQAGDPRKSLRR